MSYADSDIFKYRNFNNFAESLSSKSSQVIAQEKNEGSRPKAVEGGCFPPQYVLRHSYDYEMDWERLRIVLRKAEKLQVIYGKEIRDFIRFLDKLSEQDNAE